MAKQATPSDRVQTSGKQGWHLGLRARKPEETLTRDAPRFHIFLVDTGWNEPVSRALRNHITTFSQYHPQDPVYILSREQSVKILKTAPDHIGNDPIVLVYDSYRPSGESSREKPNYRGFRLNLGLMRHPEQAMSMLHQFLRFIATHRTAECLSGEVERELHRRGLGNMVKLLREASEASLELL